MPFDVCVIGAGMIGSSAARHTSANPALSVCLIGPCEPTAEERKNREIWSSWYDSGRITRVLDDDPACEIFSRLSIERYRDLERISGIKFHTAVGCLFIVAEGSNYLKRLLQAAESQNVPINRLSRDTFSKRYSFIKLNEGEVALLDDNGGGHIDPRKLVQAQQKVAKMQGCTVLNKVAYGLTFDGKLYEVKTEDGASVTAKRVIVSTGAFVNTKPLEVLKNLKVDKHKETIALFKMSDEEIKRLSSLPDVIYCGKDGTSGYLLPPIQYPDGNYYLKVGLDGRYQEAGDLEDIKKWYLSNGDPQLVDQETQLVKKLLPGIRFDQVQGKTCVNCYTETGVPYLDRVTPTLTVAVGGNGKAAKFSDEVGRLAACLCVEGRWDSELLHDRFETRFE